MISVRLNNVIRQPLAARCFFVSTQTRSTENEDKSGTAKPKVAEESNTKEKAKLKLQNLLSKIVNESISDKNTVKLPHPVKREVEKRPVYNVKLDKIKDQHVVKLVTAVKSVADDIGGDVKQTEAELLHVLLNNNKPDSLSGEKQTLNKLMAEMKIEKEPAVVGKVISRSSQVRKILSSKSKQSQSYPLSEERRKEQKIDLFGHQPIGIFSKYNAVPASYSMNTWKQMEERELKLLVTHPPDNIYEEMILWTDQGKLWHFPIDNEQGLDEEKKVDFTEHVFLDSYLEPWCPAKGPLRHFMELVLVGLSKNPYITVEAKKEHIFWFRDYFEEKKKLLLEVGAVEGPSRSTQEKEV